MNDLSESDSADETVQRSTPIRPFLRWILAIGLTFSLLPFPFARLLIGSHLQHYSSSAIGLLVLGVILVPLAKRGLTDNMSHAESLRLAGCLGLGWLAFSCVLTFISTSNRLPWYVLGPAMGVSTMWLLAFTWLWPVYRRFGLKVAVLLPLFAWAVGFWQFFGIDGLNGDARVQFFYRGNEPEVLPTNPSTNPVAIVHSIELTTESFPSYLGPQRNGQISDRGLSDDWSTLPVELWRHPVGRGWSPFVGSNDFVFTQELRGETECVVCYDLETGSEVWLHTDAAAFVSALAGDGPRAAPGLTQTVDADGLPQTRIVTVGGTGLLNCLDAASGASLWQVDLLAEYKAENLVHGTCISPLIIDDKVIACPVGIDGPCIAAYRLSDGKPIWTGGSETHRRASYSSPMVAEIHDRRQIILHCGPGVCGFDIDMGKELWFFPWTNQYDNNAAQPLIGVTSPNRILASTGYGRGSALFEVTYTDGTFATESIWDSRSLKSKYSTPIAFQNEIYGLDDGILTCLDAQTGKRLWKRGRYGHGQILLVDDLLLVQCEAGEIALVRPSKKALDEIARVPALTMKTWNHLCLIGSKLLVRNDREAVCLQLPVSQ